jgi:PAS domain S-box-containing protein
MPPSPLGLPGGTAESILSQAPDALLLVDPAGVIRYANPAVGPLLGYAPEDLQGRPVEDLVPERFRETHVRYRTLFSAAPVAREMAARVVALSARRADGREIPVEIRLAPLESGDGRYVVAAMRDVSERRRMLEDLQAARQEAERANRAKTRFLVTASHDLRQPLQTLQLLAGALVRQLEGQPAADLVMRQLRAMDSMADLLNVLLDVSKLESGGVRPTLAEVSMADLFMELARHFEAAAASRGLAMTVAAPPLVIRSDRVLLRQLLQNLVSNALKFTREGGVHLAAMHLHGVVVVTVTDTGIGIAAPDLERIFDEYFQVAGAGAGAGAGQGGFGLGLTIVRRLASLLNIQVAVESAPGQGTTFRLTLPADALVTSPAAAGPPSGNSLPAGAALKPAVLIVEDDAPVRAALELLLSLEGYPVQSAGTAADALALFRAHRDEIDIVLTDYHLDNEETGLSVLKQLRTIAGRDLPAVVLSGDTSSIVGNLVAIDRVRVLRKPADVAQLVGAMEALFGESA